MTINQAISTFRLRLARWDDDFSLQDEAIFKLLSDSMAIVFTRYKDKWNLVSEWMYSTYGVKLQMVGADMFPCEDIEHCTLLESVHTIPEPLMGRNTHMFRVYNGNTELPRYTGANEFDEYLKNKPSWNIVNGKLRIYNNKMLKAVTVKTIPYNIMEWYDKQYCPSTDTVECWNLDEMVWPLFADPKMQGMCMDLALQQLGFNLQKLENQNGENPQH